jgi:hypothetical protein
MRYEYHYRIVPPQGQVTILERDTETVRRALDGAPGTCGSVLSHQLVTPREMFSLCRQIQPGSMIEVSSTALSRLNQVAAWAQCYPDCSFSKCCELGMDARALAVPA